MIRRRVFVQSALMFVLSGRSCGASAAARGQEDGSCGGVEENAGAVQSHGWTETAAAG